MKEQSGAAVAKGVTTVLMQGGLNSALPLEYYVEMVSETVRLYPQVTPHYFSAPEIMKMVDVSGKSIGEVLRALKGAGYRSLPGVGSEILSNRVKAQSSRFRPQGKVVDWTRGHEEAHASGRRGTPRACPRTVHRTSAGAAHAPTAPRFGGSGYRRGGRCDPRMSGSGSAACFRRRSE